MLNDGQHGTWSNKTPINGLNGEIF